MDGTDTDSPVLGLVTAPTNDGARIARTLVDRGLAACVNVVPAVESVYRWQGEVEQATESLLVVKTTAANVSEIDAALREVHPYDVYELVVLDIGGGSPAYLEWIADSVASTASTPEV
jgi:periplasmic divalent cation tolerance protein